jgi:hypothetical protein
VGQVQAAGPVENQRSNMANPTPEPQQVLTANEFTPKTDKQLTDSLAIQGAEESGQS